MYEQIASYFFKADWANLPLFLSCVSVFVCVIVLKRLSSLRKTLNDDKEKLEKRLRIITSGAVGMGEKLVKLESRLADAMNSQMQAAEVEAQYSYTQALKLIESGVEHSVVMSNSGLSQSEVNLMELLHQTRNDVTHSN